jgi:uncharacterized membrane protein YbaN (DUF454 family)
MYKIIYNIIGGFSLVLGILGAFLPLLPSTCFILVATWAFAKSSPAFHHWLYYQSPFSNSIQDWTTYRVIPAKVKWIATLSIIGSYLITVLLIDNIYIVGGLGIGMAVLLLYLHSKPSCRSNSRPSHLSNSGYVSHPPFLKSHRQVI